MNELAQTNSVGALLRPVAPVADLMTAHTELAEVIQKCMKEGLDYGVVPGTGGDEKKKRETLFKAGAERLLFAFGLYADFEILEQDIDHDRRFVVKRKKWRNAHRGDKEFTWIEDEAFGLYRFVSKCRLINRATGEVVGTGTGICSSLESKYSDRPREVENTILKMADKRAMIAACLITFGLSDRFTQDEGDPEVEEPKEPAKPATPTEEHKEQWATAFLEELDYDKEEIEEFKGMCAEKGYKWYAIALQAKREGSTPLSVLESKPSKTGDPQTPETPPTPEPEEREDLTGKALYEAVKEAQAS